MKKILVLILSSLIYLSTSSASLSKDFSQILNLQQRLNFLGYNFSIEKINILRKQKILLDKWDEENPCGCGHSSFLSDLNSSLKK